MDSQRWRRLLAPSKSHRVVRRSVKEKMSLCFTGKGRGGGRRADMSLYRVGQVVGAVSHFCLGWASFPVGSAQLRNRTWEASMP